MLGGAIRVSTPFMFVALGECLTEKSGRINLGLEGNLVLGAMVAYAVSYLTGSGLARRAGRRGSGSCSARCTAISASCRGQRHRRRHRLMSFGTGLAFFFGKPYIQPTAPRLEAIPLGDWTATRRSPRRCRSTRCSSSASRWPVFLWWALRQHPLGPDRAHDRRQRRLGRAMGVSVDLVRLLATAAGGFLAGVGGAFLSLYYPGSWNEGLSSGQGLMAVALVIFARWDPMRCVWAALLFGAAGAIGPALQSVGISQGYYFFNAAPYILTLFIMIASARSKSAAREAPGELSIVK
jgi:general nucleoside transport system permease protein